MQRLFITKDNLKLLIKNQKRDCDEFIAPKKENLDDIVFGDTKKDNRELLEYDGNSVISPRAFLLPQTEVLFKINSAGDCDFSPFIDKKKLIFYGVRPCDIKALRLMRKFFLEDVVDLPYQERLSNSTLIALACTKRCFKESFCHQIGAGPLAKDGFDLQLIAISKGYLVIVGSKKGAKIVQENRKLFKNTKPVYENEVKNKIRDFTQGVRPINVKKVAKIMKEDKVKGRVWDDIGLRCVACSGCITLCPTCSCFSITDRLNGNSGMRLRYCDGCPFAGFTRMAGGNSQAPLHKDQIRRFFEHKLNIDVDRYGVPSCVGCARCIKACPGNISIGKFIEAVL